MIVSVPIEEFSYGLDLSGADPASLNDALRAVTLDEMISPYAFLPAAAAHTMVEVAR